MKKIFSYIKTTIVGGILLLIPLTVLLFVLEKAIRLVQHIVAPVAKDLPFDVPGIGVATLLTILVLLLLCFLAGIFMHTRVAQHFKTAIENNILVHVPGYSYLEALSTDKLSVDHQSGWKPAVTEIDGSEVICFVIDESAHYCSVFLPSAPTPSEGSVCVREKQDIRYLPINMSETITLLKSFGRGGAMILEKMRAAPEV